MLIDRLGNWLEAEAGWLLEEEMRGFHQRRTYTDGYGKTMDAGTHYTV